MIDIAHGEIDVEWFDNVLISAPLGSINGAGAKMFAEKICISITTKAPAKPWVRGEFFRDFYTLATPDAYPFFLKSLICSLRNQCELICVIGVNNCNMSLFESYSKLVGLPFLAFSRLSSLVNFLNKEASSITWTRYKNSLSQFKKRPHRNNHLG